MDQQRQYIITKSCLYNVDSIKPHFYVVKLGFTGDIHYFSYFCSHRLWVLLCFELKYEKYQNFYLKTFSFWWWIFFIFLNRHDFVMIWTLRWNGYEDKEYSRMFNIQSTLVLEIQGTLWNTSRYPYFDISDLRNWEKQLIEQPPLIWLPSYRYIEDIVEKRRNCS